MSKPGYIKFFKLKSLDSFKKVIYRWGSTWE